MLCNILCNFTLLMTIFFYTLSYFSPWDIFRVPAARWNPFPEVGRSATWVQARTCRFPWMSAQQIRSLERDQTRPSLFLASENDEQFLDKNTNSSVRFLHWHVWKSVSICLLFLRLSSKHMCNLILTWLSIVSLLPCRIAVLCVFLSLLISVCRFSVCSYCSIFQHCDLASSSHVPFALDTCTANSPSRSRICWAMEPTVGTGPTSIATIVLSPSRARCP